jgi:hypothetical protein
MWLARNPSGELLVFNDKPEFNVDKRFEVSERCYYDEVLYLPENEFPEITFKNSPVEITNTGLSDILDILNNISETLASDIEQENNNLSSCDNSSDILDKTYNYCLGLIQGYAHAQCLISQMFAKKVSEFLKTDKNVNK